MKSKLFVALLIILLGLPLSLAFDCNSIQNRDYCEEIMNSALTEAEKDYLLADIMSNTKHYPDHQLVKGWNSNIPTDVAPNGVSKQDQGYIKNAWVKILAVMPSVLDNGELFVNKRGEAIAGSNHEVEIPTHTDSGDCRTERSLVENEGNLRIYANDEHLSDNNYRIDDDAVFKAEYNIRVKTRIKHYRWIKPCEECSRVCRYDNIEYKTDTLTVKDELNAKLSSLNPEAEFSIKDQYLDTTKADFNFNDVVNVELLFDDASFLQHNYVFSEVASLEPLHVLTVKAEKQVTQQENNLVYEDDEIILKNTAGCRIKVYDFFNNKVIPCNLDFNQIDFTVETDKNIYEQNETITVKIEPEAEYLVQYGEQQFLTNGRAELVAKYPANRISVTQQDKIEYKHIHVKDETSWSLFVTLGIFGGLNCVLVGFIKRFWGVLF
ncbi:MAG: hypothetical protein KJ597_00540 [Nanoarchaeota archaeon]|nr:hypothetical protein [Nanoarchaeota archaeon]MBU1622040.1 hypothetical protein [Nanoarchaeota archaeon]